MKTRHARDRHRTHVSNVATKLDPMTPEKNRRTTGQFAKGRSGNPRGRPRGSPNKATREIRDFARTLLEDPSYVKSLKARLRAGKAPQLEALLYHYGYGKPKETHEGTGEYLIRWQN